MCALIGAQSLFALSESGKMSQFMFGVSQERLTRTVAKRVDAIASSLDIDFYEVFNLPDTGYQRWFACQNRGFPFDQAMETRLYDALREACLLNPDGTIKVYNTPEKRL